MDRDGAGVSSDPAIYTMKIVNFVLLCIQCLFMLVFMYISAKYIKQFSSFKDFYTLMTLITLIISLLWDCVALPDSYPWYNLDINDMLSFASIQLSKGFFLLSIVMYATRWVQIMMKNNSSTPQQIMRLRIAMATFVIFSFSLEVVIICKRSLNGA